MIKYREIYKNGRRYYEDIETGKKVPSVTTVTSQSSPFTGRPGSSAIIGKIIHYHIIKHIKSESEAPKDVIWNLPDNIICDKIISGLKMWRDLNVKLNIIGVEDVVLNHEYGYGGRPDLYGYDPAGIYTVDEIKTGGFYEHYYLQGAAYAKMVGAEQVRFIQLDVNTVRNPERIGKIIVMNKSEIDRYFEEFINLLGKFVESDQ